MINQLRNLMWWQSRNCCKNSLNSPVMHNLTLALEQLTLSCWIHFRRQEIKFVFPIIPQHCSSWNNFSYKTRIHPFYTVSREYRVIGDRYSQLLFTSEDRLCTNLHVQEQLTNMTSQCIRVTSQINCGDVTMLGHQWRNEQSMTVFSGVVYSGHKIVCKK